MYGARCVQKFSGAIEFLEDVLSKGPVSKLQIDLMAEKKNIRSRTLWSAKKKLNIRSVKNGNQWFWALPE